MELKADLRGALERGELRVEYQPIVELDTGVISGSEALMRWDHPQRGSIPPIEFIPVAEETGSILELGRWILETACRQTKAWREETGVAMTISVNVSGRQMTDAQFVTDVSRALELSGLDPGCLTLEITESVLVHDVDATVAAFRALKALGIRLAIDDFGTGYSSLSYLRQFPIDTLKVDRSFVAGLDGSNDSVALVRSILNLSSTLKLDTVAEGIETSVQRKALVGLGAHRGQGYLFHRPMPPEDLRELLIGGVGHAVTMAQDRGPRAPSKRHGRTPRGSARPPTIQPSPTTADEVH